MLLRTRLLALLLGIVWSPAAAASCLWQVFYPPNRDQTWNFLDAISVVGQNDVWAAGTYNGPSGYVAAQVVHFNGTKWSEAKSPDVSKFSALAILAISDTNIWVVGSRVYHRLLSPSIVHWDGARWAVVHTPADALNGAFQSIAEGGNELWVAGWFKGNAHDEPLVEHLDGSSWVMDSPFVPDNNAFIFSIVAASQKSIWAGGQGVVEHFTPSSGWVDAAQGITGDVVSMSARNERSVWALGPEEGGPFVDKWEGNTWVSIPYPRSSTTALMTSIEAKTSTGYVWVTGLYDNRGIYTEFVDRYRNGIWEDTKVAQAGSWQNAPDVLAAVPGTPDLWAVGHYTNTPSESFNLAERWTCPAGEQ